MKSFLVVVVILILIALQVGFNPPSSLAKANYIPPPSEIKNISFGFRAQLSDSFWLRAIQDFDFCDTVLDKNLCRGKSWLFQMISLVVELDEKFKEAYYYGAMSLSIIVSDYEGASNIFDRGVSQFPNSWPLLYAAAYHVQFEEKNRIKASGLYLSAAKNGAPKWVYSLAGSLAVAGGDTESAKSILELIIANELDQKWVEKLRKKIEAHR